jgi:hypothetical protein
MQFHIPLDIKAGKKHDLRKYAYDDIYISCWVLIYRLFVVSLSKA